MQTSVPPGPRCNVVVCRVKSRYYSTRRKVRLRCRTSIIIVVVIIIIIIIIIIEFLTSQLWLGNIHLSRDVVICKTRLGGLIL